jgi:hypothetical protein
MLDTAGSYPLCASSLSCSKMSDRLYANFHISRSLAGSFRARCKQKPSFSNLNFESHPARSRIIWELLRCAAAAWFGLPLPGRQPRWLFSRQSGDPFPTATRIINGAFGTQMFFRGANAPLPHVLKQPKRIFKTPIPHSFAPACRPSRFHRRFSDFLPYPNGSPIGFPVVHKRRRPPNEWSLQFFHRTECFSTVW